MSDATYATSTSRPPVTMFACPTRIPRFYGD